MIPHGFIQDLVARTDLVDVVGRYVQLKRGGANYIGLCPFHGEKSPSFTVSPTKQFYHCFGCGAHGNAIGFLMEHLGLSFVEAVKELASQSGLQVPEDRRSPAEQERERHQRDQQDRLAEALDKASAYYRKQLKASARAIDYLKGRGLSGEIAARFALGYAPDSWRNLANVFPMYDDPALVEAGLVIAHDEDAGGDAKRYDRFRDRVMFPIRSMAGQVIGFGGRVLDRGEPKYLNSPETPLFVKGRELYGLFEARAAIRERGYVLVVEGYMDVVALAQLGLPNAVATLGTACTEEHVKKLFRFADKVVFSFDGDAAGRRAAGRALEATLPHAQDTRQASFLFLPPEHDPDSFIRQHGRPAFEAQVAQAVPLSQQLLRHAADGCDLAIAEGRAALVATALPLLARLPDGALRANILQDLADQSRVSVADLTEQVGALRQKADGTPGYPPGTPAGQPASAMRGQPEAGGRQDHRPRSGRTPWTQSRAVATEGAARPLDRVAWLLIHQSELWEHLPGETHELLVDQAPPYGPFFAWFDRLLHDQGPVAADALLTALEHEASDADSPTAGALAHLKRRVTSLLPLARHPSATEELDRLLVTLRLAEIDEQLEMLASLPQRPPEADRQMRELLEERPRLKARLLTPVPPPAS